MIHGVQQIQMKNLFSISRIFSTLPCCFYQKIQTELLHTKQTRTRSAKKGSVSVAVPLYRRISPLGDPNVSLIPVLDQWVKEGNSTYRGELRRIIKELTVFKRFKHALEVSLWMTNQRHYPVSPFDVSVRLKLLYKVFGLEQVEDYFSKVPENLKDYPVYLALLNCYCMAKSVDKAECIMQKARDCGYVSKPIWYNLLMNMHCQLGNREKVSELLKEMEAKGISADQFTYSVCLTACAMASDAEGMDKVMMVINSGPRVRQWKTYVIAVNGYLKMGLMDKALTILEELESRLKRSRQNTVLYSILLNLYAEAGKKDDLYRVWYSYKENCKVLNKVYISMMRSLMKFDDIEEVEKIYEEWESEGLPFDFRIPDFLITGYCAEGHLDKAETLITRRISRGGKPLVKTWLHLASGYLKEDQLPKAVEALKKAISVCPPKSRSTKDSLATCLKYLESGDCIEKAEEILKSIRMQVVFGEFGVDDSDSTRDEDLEESILEEANSEENCSFELNK